MLIILFFSPLIQRSFSKMKNKNFKFKKLIHNLLELHMESKTEPDELMKIIMQLKKDLILMEKEEIKFNRSYRDLCEKDANSIKIQFKQVQTKINFLKSLIGKLTSLIKKIKEKKLPELEKNLSKEITLLKETENSFSKISKKSNQKPLEINEKIRLIKEIVFLLSSSNLIEPFHSMSFIELKQKVKSPLNNLFKFLELDSQDSNYYNILSLLVKDIFLENSNHEKLTKSHLNQIIQILFEMKNFYIKSLNDLKINIKDSKDKILKKIDLIKLNIRSLNDNINSYKNEINVKNIEKKESEISLINLTKILNDYENNSKQRSKECTNQEIEFDGILEYISKQKLYLKKILGKFIEYSPEEIKNILKNHKKH